MAYKDIILADTPALYWRFNEFQGVFSFDEIIGLPLEYIFLNSGIVNQQQQGLINDPNFCVEVNHAYARGIVPYNYSTPGSFEIWFRATDIETETAILLSNYRDDDDWSFELRTSSLGGQLILDVNSSRGKISLPASGININDGAIYHVAITYDGEIILLYVNGLVRAISTSLTIIDSKTDFACLTNRYFGDLSTQYNGFFDEAAFYNYPLVSSKIQAHYAGGLNAPVPVSQGGIFASLIDIKNLSVNPKL